MPSFGAPPLKFKDTHCQGNNATNTPTTPFHLLDAVRLGPSHSLRLSVYGEELCRNVGLVHEHVPHFRLTVYRNASQILLNSTELAQILTLWRYDGKTNMWVPKPLFTPTVPLHAFC